MEQALGLVQTRKLLQDGIAKGLWTMEDLDKPPPGYIEQLANWKAACRLESARLGRDVPCHFPQYKNPLRDD
jgi:hypothetical protein